MNNLLPKDKFIVEEIEAVHAIHKAFCVYGEAVISFFQHCSETAFPLRSIRCKRLELLGLTSNTK